MKSRKKWLCLTCGIDTGKAGEHYMLKDETWFLVHNSKEGMYCVRCFEKKLGRRLTKQDFNNSHVNRINRTQFKSSILMERLKDDGLCNKGHQ